MVEIKKQYEGKWVIKKETANNCESENYSLGNDKRFNFYELLIFSIPTPVVSTDKNESYFRIIGRKKGKHVEDSEVKILCYWENDKLCFSNTEFGIGFFMFNSSHEPYLLQAYSYQLNPDSKSSSELQNSSNQPTPDSRIFRLLGSFKKTDQ